MSTTINLDKNQIKNIKESQMKVKKILCFQCLQTPLIQINADNIKLNCYCGNNITLSIKDYLNKIDNLINKCQCTCYKFKEEGVGFCFQCKKWLCINCLVKHKSSKVTQSHKTTLQNDLNLLCEKHQKNRNFYCINCKDYYCQNCFNEHKSSHHFIDNYCIVSLKEVNLKLQEVKKGEEYLDEYFNKIKDKNKLIQNIDNFKSKSEEKNRDILKLIRIIINEYNVTQNKNYNTLRNVINILDSTVIFLRKYKNGENVIGFFNTNIIIKNNNKLIQRKWTILSSDGSKYEGEWKNDQFNGYGILISPDGSKYEGQWKDDKRNGYGLFTNKDGKKFLGQWMDDIWNKYNLLKQIKTLSANYEVYSLLVLEDKRLTSSSYETINIYNPLQNYHCDISIQAHEQGVNSLSQLDKDKIISCSSDGTIKIWKIDKNNAECLNTLNAHNSIVNKVISLPKSRIVSCSFGGEIKIWNSNTFKCCQTLKEHEGDISSIILMSDNKYLVSCSWSMGLLFSHFLFVWSLNEDKLTVKDKIKNVSCSSTNSIIEIEPHLVAVGSLNSIYVVNIKEVKIEKSFETTSDIWGLLLLNDGNIMVGDEKGILYFYSKEWSKLNEKKRHDKGISCMVYLDNGCIVTGSLDKTIKIWE